MLTAILFALVLTPPADDAAAALALAKAGRDRKPAPVPAALVANLYGTDDETYRFTRQLVESGRRVTLFVGVPALEYTSRDVSVARVDSLLGSAPGVYDCFRGADGRAMFEARSPAPAFATPVRNLIYQFAPRSCAGGNCPR